MDGQSGRVPDAQHQPTHIADASGQRHVGLFTDKPQDLLPTRRRAKHRSHRREQAKGSEVQRQDYLITKYSSNNNSTKFKVI